MNRQSSGAAAEGDPPRTGNPARGAAKAAVPLSVSDLFAAALAHHQAGRLAEAEAHYRQLLAAMPDHGGALHLLGVIAYQRGSPEMAVQLIERAIKRDGSDPSYFVSCGLALEELKHFEEALECYNRALSLKPDYPEALNNRGNALQMLGCFAQAVESYNQALALRPDLVEAYFNRGEALRDLGRLDDARASYDRALAVKPDFPEIFSYRGDVLERLWAAGRRGCQLRSSPCPEAELSRGMAQPRRCPGAVRSFRGSAGELRSGACCKAELCRSALQPWQRSSAAQASRERSAKLRPSAGRHAQFRRGPQQPRPRPG